MAYSYVSVLAWPILWHIVLSVAVALSAQIAQTGEGIEQFACLNFAICFVLVFSPMIVSGLVAGAGIGAAAAVAGSVALNRLFNTASRADRPVRTMGNVIQGRSVAPQSLPPVYQTPTTMGGPFKDVMTGSKSQLK